MKKILSLILAIAMLLTVIPAVAENGTEEKGGLQSLPNGLGESGGGNSGDAGSLLSGLGSLLGGGNGDGTNLSAMLKNLLQKAGKDLKGINVDAIVDMLKEKLGGLLGGAAKGTGETGGEPDLNALTSLLGGLGESSGENKEGAATGEDNGQIMALLGSLLGGSTGNGAEGGGEEPDWDALLAAYKESDEYKDALGRWNALALHLNEVFPGLAAGDEQVIVMSEVFKLGESDPNVEFGWYVLANYRKSENGKNLTMVSAGGAVELITYEKQEDGTFKVASAITALDGSSMFESMVKGMCDRYGVTYEDYISAMKWREFNEVSFLLEFMSDHPEYERIEYKGAMVTAKELDEMQNKMYEETAAALEAETGAAQ